MKFPIFILYISFQIKQKISHIPIFLFIHIIYPSEISISFYLILQIIKSKYVFRRENNNRLFLINSKTRRIQVSLFPRRAKETEARRPDRKGDRFYYLVFLSFPRPTNRVERSARIGSSPVPRTFHVLRFSQLLSYFFFCASSNRQKTKAKEEAILKPGKKNNRIVPSQNKSLVPMKHRNAPQLSLSNLSISSILK